MLDLGYPPHVTLAVFDHLDANVAAAALDDVLKRIGQFEVALTGIATLGSGSGACYAALAPSSDLHRLHETVLATIGEPATLSARPMDAPLHAGAEFAGCRTGARADLLARDWRPVTGVYEIADFVEFAPVAGTSGAGRFRLPDPMARPEPGRARPAPVN